MTSGSDSAGKIVTNSVVKFESIMKSVSINIIAPCVLNAHFINIFDVSV